MELHEIIKANFHTIRKKKGLRVQDMAEARGIKPQSIYTYFRKGSSIATLQKLADFLGVQPYELLTPIDKKTNFVRCPHCGQLIPTDAPGEE